MTDDPRTQADSMEAAKARLIDYWWDVDANDARQARDFYVERCTYLMCDHRMEGPDAVAQYYAYRASRGARLVRHVLTNLRAHKDSKKVRVQGVLTVYAADGVPVLPSMAPILVADNEATFMPCDDGVWRMSEHRIIALFQAPGQLLVPPSA